MRPLNLYGVGRRAGGPPFLATRRGWPYPPAFPRYATTLSQENRRTERKYLRFAGVGIQFAVAIALFTLGGYWLDGKFPRVRPLFTVLGLLLGFVGATTSLIYQVSPPGKGKKKTKKK